MNSMFSKAVKFNQPLGGWNTSSVKYMSRMFEGAESFNQPIGSWQVERVELIERMFAGAVSFNHDLGQWHLDSLKKAKEMEQFLSGADSFDYTVNRLPVLKCRRASES